MSAERPVIVTDSTAELHQLREASQNTKLGQDIAVAKLLVMLGSENWLDDPTLITTPELLRKMTETHTLATTSAPNPTQFTDIYSKIPPERPILSIHIQKEFSGTVNHASEAKLALGNDGDRITVIDGRGTSLFLAWQALEAKRLSDNGVPIGEIVPMLEEMRKNMNLFFSLKELDFAIKGGRINKIKGRLASAFKILPTLQLIDGELQIAHTGRTWTKTLDNMASEVENMGVLQRIGIMHADANQRELDSLVSRLQPHSKEPITVSMLGPIISIYSGPGGIGIVTLNRMPESYTSYPL